MNRKPKDQQKVMISFRLPRREAEGIALLQKLDEQITAISNQRDSDSKEKKLRYLRWKRQDIEKKYTEPMASRHAAERRP